MKKLILVGAITVALGIGTVIGAMFTPAARADGGTPTYVLVPVTRIDKDDPVAIRMNTVTGQTTLIYRDGRTHGL